MIYRAVGHTGFNVKPRFNVEPGFDAKLRFTVKPKAGELVRPSADDLRCIQLPTFNFQAPTFCIQLSGADSFMERPSYDSGLPSFRPRPEFLFHMNLKFNF